MSEVENLDVIDSEEKADAALEAIEAPSGGPIVDAPQAPQTVDEFELTVGGKQIKAKRDQVLQWAQQGYSAPGKMSQLTKEIEKYKKQWSEHEPLLKTYKEKYDPIDQYVREKPEFWDHVMDSWNKRNQALTDQGNPLASVVGDLQKQVQDLIQYKNQAEEQTSKYRAAQEDQEYIKGLEGLKKEYADIDFDSPDEEGKSLEYRILEHAQANGIGNFKSAFRDYYHDELIKRSESRAKESLTKEKQKNTKLGILGLSPQPAKRAQQGDVRSKSYDDLASEALAEYGIR